jgi:hypothetical protein
MFSELLTVYASIFVLRFETGTIVYPGGAVHMTNNCVGYRERLMSFFSVR